ncbi:hypothetical protein PTUN_a1038 [Pseudoalteromonas tunicata]|nr:hypothetical protein PTUN_a1038 [Pseudoalteromonas tunicata]
MAIIQIIKQTVYIKHKCYYFESFFFGGGSSAPPPFAGI